MSIQAVAEMVSGYGPSATGVFPFPFSRQPVSRTNPFAKDPGVEPVGHDDGKIVVRLEETKSGGIARKPIAVGAFKERIKLPVHCAGHGCDLKLDGTKNFRLVIFNGWIGARIGLQRSLAGVQRLVSVDRGLRWALQERQTLLTR